MKIKHTLIIVLLIALKINGFSQNFSFNFFSSGRRVCLVSSEVDLNNHTVKVLFHDSTSNNSELIYVNRRLLGTYPWINVASALPAGTGFWLDTNVAAGEIWEYQVKRYDTWTFQSNVYDATGYTMGCLLSDNTLYKGQLILLVADNIPANLAVKYQRLKKELTADAWFVNEVIVPKATSWDSGNEVIGIKNQINSIYANAPVNDKPKVLFILGHVPMPRCGSTDVVAPDDHSQNTGARGCDAYYADIDGIFTDTATYNPGGLSTPLAINLPGDYKWDQDFFPSDIEMAFGRIDFADITEISLSELSLIENYLDRLSHYKNVSAGFDMGDKTAFYFGYNNSNDGSFRTLPNISTPDKVYQNATGPNHNQWVQDNGPFKVYMQNQLIPSIADWQTYGMNASVYASDQSYWGFGDVPQPLGQFSRIRTVLGVDSKCVVALWTTTGINIFHQARTGMPIGLSLKEIMNHNANNQYLEKPPQQYDTEDWWNRTHFEIWGDPTITLYQVPPPSNLSITDNSGVALLQWTSSSDTSVIGYHIYESDAELGVYQRISSSPITGHSYQIANYTQGNWYMVKAVKVFESGCGKFLHPSLGESIQANIVLNSNMISKPGNVRLYPNPLSDKLFVNADIIISHVKVTTASGVIILNVSEFSSDFMLDLTEWPDGVYIIELQTNTNERYFRKIIKNKGANVF